MVPIAEADRPPSWPEHGHHEGVKVPGRGHQPVHQQESSEYRVAQQVPRGSALMNLLGLVGHFARSANQEPGDDRQCREKQERGAKPRQVDDQTGHQRADEVRGSGCNRQPGKCLLQVLGRLGGSADMSLQGDVAGPDGAAAQHCGEANHRVHRPHGGNSDASGCDNDAPAHGALQAMAVGKTPGR